MKKKTKWTKEAEIAYVLKPQNIRSLLLHGLHEHPCLHLKRRQISFEKGKHASKNSPLSYRDIDWVGIQYRT